MDEQHGILYPDIIYKAFSENDGEVNKEVLNTGYFILNSIKAGDKEINQDNFDLEKWANISL